jgi:hypothetical protein
MHGQQWHVIQAHGNLRGENFLSGERRIDKLGETLLISWES